MPAVVRRPETRPSGEAPSQPCTSSSRMTRNRHACTTCPVTSTYLMNRKVSLGFWKYCSFEILQALGFARCICGSDSGALRITPKLLVHRHLHVSQACWGCREATSKVVLTSLAGKSRPKHACERARHMPNSRLCKIAPGEGMLLLARAPRCGSIAGKRRPQPQLLLPQL